MWPKFGQEPILTSEMLLRIGTNHFLAKGDTSDIVLTLGQQPTLRPCHFCYFGRNVLFLAKFQNFVGNHFGQILAKHDFLGQVWPKIKADVFFWQLEKTLGVET